MFLVCLFRNYSTLKDKCKHNIVTSYCNFSLIAVIKSDPSSWVLRVKFHVNDSWVLLYQFLQHQMIVICWKVTNINHIPLFDNLFMFINLFFDLSIHCLYLFPLWISLLIFKIKLTTQLPSFCFLFCLLESLMLSSNVPFYLSVISLTCLAYYTSYSLI